MSAYYNEYDEWIAAWLRDLIREGLIAPGVVDERPIQEVSMADLRGFVQCHFFSGIAGWPLALDLAGWSRNQRIWTGSCPCQPFSSANGRRRGFDDERHLWPELFRLVSQCRPPILFGEQVDAAANHDWLDRVHTDLGRGGYAVGAAVFPAAAVGAPHRRNRLYLVAYSDRLQLPLELGRIRRGAFRGGVEPGFWADVERVRCPDGKRRLLKPGICPMADGVPGYMGLVRGAGNAIVPQQAAEFIRAAVEAITDLEG